MYCSVRLSGVQDFILWTTSRPALNGMSMTSSGASNREYVSRSGDPSTAGRTQTRPDSEQIRDVVNWRWNWGNEMLLCESSLLVNDFIWLCGVRLN